MIVFLILLGLYFCIGIGWVYRYIKVGGKDICTISLTLFYWPFICYQKR